jgi:hypothetical protein
MKDITCTDREAILREAQPEALRALEIHAASCAECREELALWNEISGAARAMHREWESPDLWPRIRQALAAESVSPAPRRVLGFLPAFWEGWQPGWPRMAVVATLALLVVMSASTLWLVTKHVEPLGQVPVALQPAQGEDEFLTEKALREIEQAEAAYARSIDRLASMAARKLDDPALPLAASYREKLLVLDSAIAELRQHAEANPLNAHLRAELISLYQDKARTLEAVMREGNRR